MVDWADLSRPEVLGILNLGLNMAVCGCVWVCVLVVWFDLSLSLSSPAG